MYKIAIAFCLLVSMVSCGSSEDKPAGKEDRQSQTTPPQSLEPFADSLVRLEKFAPHNIEKSAHYFTKLVPPDSTLADSASVMLLKFVKGVVDTINQKIWKDTMDLADLVYPGGKAPTQQQRNFQALLKSTHIDLQGNGEGDVVAVLDYKWINDIIQSKTSAATDAYLSLVAAEETEPTLQDAGLAIELKELVSRAVLSERLLEQKMPVSFIEGAKEYNRFYTNVLLLGSDNSPSIEDETSMSLVTEFKRGYEYLLATYPDTRVAQKIKEWLEIVKTKNKTKLQQLRAAQYQ